MLENEVIQAGDLVLICEPRSSGYIKRLFRVANGRYFDWKGGRMKEADLLGKPYGSVISKLILKRPTFEEIVMYGFKREGQIIYPKDAALIASKLGIRDGSKVLEIGTGTGSMCAYLNRAAAPSGSVISYEIEERFFKLARTNLNMVAATNAALVLADATCGTCVRGADAAVVDMKDCIPVKEVVRTALKSGAPICFICPTTNQVQEILKNYEGSFVMFEVMEVLVRDYKANSERLRPNDRMVAHTTFLVFAVRAA